MSSKAPEFLQSFSELIACPSVSSVNPEFDQGNAAVIDKLANWLTDLGFAVEKMQVSENPDKFNLVASIGRGEGGLVFAGHTDTVPFNEEQWQQDPFHLTQKDDRLYGLGASDMKCFFPVVMDVLNSLDMRAMKQPLYILATADEESTMAGARAMHDSGRKLGRHAVIGEPTGLIPIRMHKGVLMESISLTGTAGHSSNPAFGNSALEGMHKVMSALMDWRLALQDKFTNDAFQVPVPTLNFGSIRGGDNPNRICASCVMTIDVRLMPGMQVETVRRKLHEVIYRSVNDSGLDVHIHSLFGGVPPFQTSNDAEIVRVAESVCRTPAGSVTFGTEGPYLNRMGMETIILGPGNIDQAHQANEYVALDRIQPMKDIIRHLIGHFCLGENRYVQ